MLQTILLPATALVAVLIFIAKELLELYRRWRADSRRRVAIKALLARECELNNWAIHSLRHISTELMDVENPESKDSFNIEYAKSGRIYACIDSRNKGLFMKISVPRIHKDQIETNLLDIATLDKKLFLVAEPALTAVAELEHLRESLLYHGSEEDEDVRAHAPSFAEYALKELEESEGVLSTFYKACTGKELSDIRIR